MAVHLRPLPVFLLAVALVLTGGCLEGDPPSDAQVVRTITPHEASALIDEQGDDPDFIIIDVRRPDEFAAGHIPGAININSAEFSEHIDGLDAEATYLIYCQRGSRSTGVREAMRDAGFREVYEIEGGISAWRAAGLPVTG
ncbi:Thiosulfate sulfurtransferase GlpE [Methanoculleus chikugoensis]|jgi:rhodanese-related sulfurtransferase|uniref:Thiosulfate sulfurtransferase GlpE n=1 Tax=Methanoculleus chikugoensis TaxID=118126 RepID=A0A1M4MI28_9EURY|nr:rhodanese-like domain-containing protein [Methanoculleus chikugoensis]MDD4568053.1 rhodanese-like domain-containing protein [Methanoculleus chikugoensis]SCL74523.1 Thiosulfate sulfurtransferase GlpE [Methanoculleus chikugoensis]